MKASLLLATLVLALGTARAAAPHPSVLMVKVRDKMVPVVRVIGTDPVVLVDGQEKRIRTDPVYLIQRAEAYGEGTVRIKQVSLGAVEIKNVATAADAQAGITSVSEGPRFGTAYFQATITAKQFLHGSFIAIVVYGDQGRPDVLPQSELIVHELPDLPAGQPVPVKLTAAIPNGQSHLRYFMQVFDATGRELYSNWSVDGWPFYAQREKIILHSQVEKYLARNPGANHALEPVLMARPIFPEGVAVPTAPAAAVLTVGPDGTVAHVDVQGISDPAASTCVGDTLSGWFFLPQLKQGAPVTAKVKIPLQF
jgi:hypothetical protein